MARIFTNGEEIATLKNLFSMVTSAKNATEINDKTDLNLLSPGYYVAWGDTPVNAPQNVQYARYFSFNFYEDSQDVMFQIIVTLDGDIYFRVKQYSWKPWKKINFIEG